MPRLVGAALIAVAVPLSLISCDKSPQGSDARGGTGAAASGGDGGVSAATNGGQTGVGGASGGTASAGSAGNSGSAGAGGGGGGEPSDAPAWILDAARWKQLPGTSFTEPGCQFRWTDQADLPPLSWTSCGAGCEQADLDSSLSYGIATTLSVDARDGGVTTLGSIRRIIRLPQWNVAVSYALSMTSGERIGSVLRYDVPASSTEAVCGFGFPRTSARNNLIWGTHNGAHEELNIWAPTRTTDWMTVGKPATLAVPAKFAFDFDWDGGRLIGLGGNVVMQASHTSDSWEPIDSSPTARFGAGQGDLAVWVDVSLATTKTRLNAWSPAKNTQELSADLGVEGVETCGVALSPTHIVGRYASACDSETDAGLWVAPRAYEAVEFSKSIGPLLVTGRARVVRLQTWGDYAALALMFEGNGPASYEIAVVRLSDFRSWRFTAPNQEISQAVTLDDAYLYVGLGVRSDATSSVRKFKRIDLSQLDGAAKEL